MAIKEAPTPIQLTARPQRAVVAPGLQPVGVGRQEGLERRLRGDLAWHSARAADVVADAQHLQAQVMRRKHEVWAGLLTKVPLLCPDILNTEEQVMVAGLLRQLSFAAGETLVEEGNVGDSLLVIEAGTCFATQASQDHPGQVAEVFLLERGDFLGHAALLKQERPHRVTVRAKTEVKVLQLCREELLTSLGETRLSEMQARAQSKAFVSIPLLSQLPAPLKARVGHRLSYERWSQGSTLATPCSVVDRLMFVEDGECLVEGNNAGTILGPGECIGMNGFLFRAPIGARVTAASDEVVTMSISLEDLLACAEGEEERLGMERVMRRSLREHLLRLVPQVGRLTHGAFLAVVEATREVAVEQWAVIIAKGSPLDILYVLQAGTVVQHDVCTEDMVELRDLETLHPEQAVPGTLLGSAGLLQQGALATETVVAATECRLLRIPSSAVWSAFNAAREHINRIAFLSEGSISREEQLALVHKMQPCSFAPGAVIICEGEVGDRLYAVQTGVCMASRGPSEELCRKFERGDSFGEMNVLEPLPAETTVRAHTEVEALTLSRNDLAAVLSADRLVQMRSGIQSRDG